MKYTFSTDDQALHLYEALASKHRLRIIELLTIAPMNIKQIAQQLSISSATATVHVRKMEECDLVSSEPIAGKHGRQKMCHLLMEGFETCFTPPPSLNDRYTHSIRIGQYENYAVQPTCGMASKESYIGQLDDPRFFSDPEHVNAHILWFGSGYVDYRFPNYLLPSQRLQRIEISMEICSEAPNYRDVWPSDISFHLNNCYLGTWTCPGNFGSTRGTLNPQWWSASNTQYGLLKVISITQEGSFIDGTKMSTTGIDHIPFADRKDCILRIENSEQSTHVGGVSLLGRGFGNYDQDIDVHMVYERTGI